MKKTPIVLLASFLLFTLFIPLSNAASKCAIHGALPDHSCTPGATFVVTAAQVCTPGYSKSVRNVSTATKNAVYAAYGIKSHTATTYEMDHFIPLELGGSNDVKNLFPEAAKPTPGFHEKDKVENYLHGQVCAGKISLSAAQHQIATNWLSVYKSMNSAKKPAPKAQSTKKVTTPKPKLTTDPTKVTDGSFLFQVDRVETEKSLRNVKSPTSSQHLLPGAVLVFVVIGNMSETTQAVDTSLFKIIDDQGRQYDLYAAGQLTFPQPASSLKKIRFEQLQPSAVIANMLMFYVPTNTTNLKLLVKGDFLSSGKTINLQSFIPKS